MKHGERLLVAGLGIFIVAKLLIILLPIEALGVPRNGDDSLYVLWGGQQIQQGYDLTVQALADIQMQAVLQDKVTEFQEWYRSRALFRSVGTHSPILDLMNATILAIGLPWKWSYAILEILVALVMGTGIAVFLRHLFGCRAAAAGLILLSFVVLPLRGLHYFAASELALSLSLVLWGYMLRHGAQSRLPLLLGGWFTALAIHPIGLVYLCVGLAMLFLSEGGPKAWIRYRLLTIAGSFIALAAGVQLLTAALPFLGMENAFNERGLNFSEGLVKNLTEIYDFLTLMVHDGGIVVVLVGLLGFALARDRVLKRPVIAATVAISLPLVASIFYFYPGYPGELFGRLLVPFVILLAGASGALLTEHLRTGRRWAVRSIAGVAAVIFVALTAIPNYQLVIQNLNDRRQIIDEKSVATQIAELPDRTNIIYLNADITTNAVLLAGGARFGALIGPILANTKSGKALILERRPALVAITLPDWLNMHATKGSGALGERRYGIPFALVDKLLVAREQANRPLTEVHAWVTNGSGADFALIVHGNPQSAAPPENTGRRITVPGGYSGWMRLDNRLKPDSQTPLTQLLITLPHGKGWIEGVSLGPPRRNLRWPWTDRALLAVLDRSSTSGTFAKLRFSIPQLMAGKGDRIFLPMIRRQDPVLSDESGIVFLKTVFAPRPGNNATPAP